MGNGDHATRRVRNTFGLVKDTALPRDGHSRAGLYLGIIIILTRYIHIFNGLCAAFTCAAPKELAKDAQENEMDMSEWFATTGPVLIAGY